MFLELLNVITKGSIAYPGIKINKITIPILFSNNAFSLPYIHMHYVHFQKGCGAIKHF